ncbi:MAG: ABC transporter substrate-binding protein [Propionicimonas sp.]|uniref:ABC transporter substrate-binding protein n=1 Tax=Propionicimonas sp. TaxID=1955623 RepID=UPI002B1F5BF5|nr:ABC transporter substrate-binding protein [Propionicimonas sp.]MEA4943419.1 ABC transporter substrate-binding protein [Propionicimonas sp.]
MHHPTHHLAKALVAGSAALTLLLAGCSGSQQPSASGDSGDPAKPAAGRPLRVWGGNTTPIAENFNPFNIDTALYPTFGAIYEPLFFFNQLVADPPVGLIGDSYQYSADGKVLTITIKPGQKWNDGEPLTSADVAFSLGYGPNHDAAMVSAETPDDTTAIITYTEPRFTSASLILGSTWIIPQHIWADVTDYLADTNANPVGSGPYLVKSFTEAAYTIAANPNFRDGAPAVTEVQYLGLDSNQSGQDLLATGKIDWVGQFIANPDAVTGGGRIATMNEQQDPTVILTCANADLGCKGAQTDVAVRQALNLAIGRSTIREKAFAGLAGEASPAFALLPRDAEWLSDQSLATSPQQADAAAAAAILEAAGYAKDGEGFYGKAGKAIELDLISPDGWTDYNDAAKLISEQAAAAGIRVNARTVSEAEYWTPISTGDFQLVMYGITQSLVADPYSNYDQYFQTASTAKVGEEPPRGQNYARYSNPKVDQAVKAAAATQDEASKKAAYATIQAEIARDLPYIPVVLNASQAFFNTADFTGWPSDTDKYADPLPYLSTASAIVLAHLKPAGA